MLAKLLQALLLYRVGFDWVVLGSLFRMPCMSECMRVSMSRVSAALCVWAYMAVPMRLSFEFGCVMCVYDSM